MNHGSAQFHLGNRSGYPKSHHKEALYHQQSGEFHLIFGWLSPNRDSKFPLASWLTGYLVYIMSNTLNSSKWQFRLSGTWRVCPFWSKTSPRICLGLHNSLWKWSWLPWLPQCQWKMRKFFMETINRKFTIYFFLAVKVRVSRLWTNFESTTPCSPSSIWTRTHARRKWIERSHKECQI